MYMSVHNTINVSKVICKCRAPILLIPVANLSSILILSTFSLCECAIMLVRLVCPRPLLFCSIALDDSKQKKIAHMVRIQLAWLVECGRFRECLGNNLGGPKGKYQIGRMAYV
jgi:hypothetical protein